MNIGKRQLKQFLGELPLAAELYWQLAQSGRPLSKGLSLRKVENSLPEWCQQAGRARSENCISTPKNILIFATLRVWIQHAALLGVALAGKGHRITLAYLPYANWRRDTDRFDLRRQNLYIYRVLEKSRPMMEIVSFFDFPGGKDFRSNLPESLVDEVRQVSIRDVQYSMQIEEFDPFDKKSAAGKLYLLREARNLDSAAAAYLWMQNNNPDLLITPNGSILEMGAVFQTAGQLKIPTVTYEFGEQRQRIWMAGNAEVMHQDTDKLWEVRGKENLDGEQENRIRALFASRQKADLWENFTRRWQGVPSQGGERVRTELGLDSRPIVLLAANVIGDSLTLGRQVFTNSMTEWLVRTVEFFGEQDRKQLVVRIHPGERYTRGPSVADVVRQIMPDLPDHIHLIPADAPINTYDLVDIAQVGLVYTTTTGLEMAMSGLPVIVVGKTHYRGKGFTLDPSSWEQYFNLMETYVEEGNSGMDSAQIDSAWRYAYRFFFEYPLPFPWHLHYWVLRELESWPLDRVLSAEGDGYFGDTFRYLAGEQRDWTKLPMYPDVMMPVTNS